MSDQTEQTHFAINVRNHFMNPREGRFTQLSG
jgi:hypothetical protein